MKNSKYIQTVFLTITIVVGLVLAQHVLAQETDTLKTTTETTLVKSEATVSEPQTFERAIELNKEYVMDRATIRITRDLFEDTKSYLSYELKDGRNIVYHVRSDTKYILFKNGTLVGVNIKDDTEIYNPFGYGVISSEGKVTFENIAPSATKVDIIDMTKETATSTTQGGTTTPGEEVMGADPQPW